MKKINLCRRAIQLTFLAIVFLGLYMQAKMIMIVLLPATLIFGNTFCAWFCPFGTMQEFAGKLGSLFIKKKFKMPQALQKYLQFSKFLVGGISFIALFEVFITSIDGYKNFLMLGSGAMPLALTINSVVVLSYLIIAIFFDRPYCNYLCIEGIKFNILNLLRIFTIKRNSDKCINCQKCTKICPMNIDVAKGNYVTNIQCINCLQCMTVCPQAEALSYTSRLKEIKNRFSKN